MPTVATGSIFKSADHPGGQVGKPYVKELDSFADTYRWAKQQNVDQLTRYLQRWSGEYAVIVGSGGSFSAAAAIALFREVAHQSPTTAVTPLEFISLLDRLSPRALLLSAEGKNKDILAAARNSRHSDLATAAITLTESNPLVELAQRSGALRVFPFQMDWVKDGYLATNTLLGTTLLLYRSFFGEHSFDVVLGPLFEPRRLATRRAQFAQFEHVAEAKKRGILVLHSPRARAFAIDLESKLAESALTTIQVTDLRQFAHGRHLQLSAQASTPFVVTAFNEVDRQLAAATTALFPPHTPSYDIAIDGTTDQDAAIAGLVDAMFFTEALARDAEEDPGDPKVPEFGRAIHMLDPEPLLARPSVMSVLDAAARRKAACVGLNSAVPGETVRQAAQSYLDRLAASEINAVVCDFDGTLCRAENRFEPLSPPVVEMISSLIRQGLKFSIASGRGGSLYKALCESFDAELHASITVGYYSGSLISALDEPFNLPQLNSEFNELYDWLLHSAYGHLCGPLSEIARGGQLGMRLHDPRLANRLRASVRAWLDLTGRYDWRVYCSGHSVDVLDASTSKLRVVEHVAQRHGLDPQRQVLRIGDSGREDGNDFELLSEGLSLSCDTISLDLKSCWNFSASGSNQAEAAMSYLGALASSGQAFRFSKDALLQP